MSRVYTFAITPRGKERPRFNFKTRTTYTPEATRTYEKALKRMIKTQYKGEPTNAPLIVNVEFIFKRPKSVSEKKRPFHSVKPDLDNLIKALLDAMNKVLWVDDAQVIRIKACKKYSDHDAIVLRTRHAKIDA